VIAMRHLTAKERQASANTKDAVRVTASLDEGIPPLPTDVTASLSSDTLLSPKFVALSAGTPGGQTLANNAAIEGHPAYGIEQITAAAGRLFENADTVLGTTDRFIGTTDKQLQEQLKQLHVTLLNLKVVTTYAKALVETLAQKPNCIIFSGKPATLTPESEILKSSKPLPARKP